MRQPHSILVHISLFPSHKRSQRNAKHHWRVQRHLRMWLHIQGTVTYSRLDSSIGEKRRRREKKKKKAQHTKYNTQYLVLLCETHCIHFVHWANWVPEYNTHNKSTPFFFHRSWFLEKLKIIWCKWCRGWCSWIYKLGWKVWRVELDYTTECITK